MIRKKNLKALIALATLTAVLSTGVAPVGAITSAKEDTKAVSSTQLRNVMYYGDWSIWGGEGQFYPQSIPAEDLTHLNFAFMDFNADGSFKFCDMTSAIGHPLGHKDLPYDENVSGGFSGGVLNEFQVLKQRNPNLKIGLSIGGWSKSGDFSDMAANPTARANFVKNAMEMIKNLNMDFVDLDWEYPGAGQVRQPDLVDNKNDEGTPKARAEDKQNYILLLQDLRTALDKQGKELGRTYELSAALPMANSKVTDGIDVKRMFELLDFGNIMTYDAAGAWDTVSGHQAALYSNPDGPYVGSGFSVDESVKNYISKGAKPEKIVIGAAYYTRGWEKVANNGPDKSLPGLYGTAEKVNRDADNTTQTPGAHNYAPAAVGDGGRLGGVWPWRAQNELKQKYSGLKEYWDDSAKAPYLYNESTGAFFTYDNPRSIQEKVKYVKQNNLGGMIAWMASQDATTPGSGDVRNELTHVTKVALFGEGKIPANPVHDVETFADVTLTAVPQEWGNGGEITFKVVSNSPVKSTDPAVARSERSYKTIKFPKFYVKTKDVVLSAGEGAGKVTKEGDYYVIDLAGSYEGKLIKAGDSKGYTFKVKTDKKVASVEEAITRIDVTQRMYTEAPEFGRTNVYSGPPTDDEDVNEDGKVDILDLSAVGAKYNLKKGQAGFNSPIERCDVNKDGIVDIYDITKVARKMGTTTPDPDPDPKPDPSNTWDATKAYNAGETVVYNGKTYRAKWYTKGETPGEPWNAWEEVK
ncbi:MAG: glycosyl hydrolase family 18 protein [Clostridium sp.]